MGLSLSVDTTTKAAFLGIGLALFLVLAANVVIPEIERVGERTGIFGNGTNSCTRQSSPDGTISCQGEFRDCAVIDIQQVCAEAGCTWKADTAECVWADGDDPSCDQLSLSNCELVNPTTEGSP